MAKKLLTMKKRNKMHTARLIQPLAMIMLLTLWLNPLVQAQQPMQIEEIKVIAPYVPTISDAFKINDTPRITDTLDVQINFEYSIFPRRIDTRYELEPIAPARMRGEPLARLYRGQVNAGFGTYSTPYLEAFYNSLRSNDYAMGVHLKHMSSTGKVQDYDFSGYSDNRAGIFGKRFFREHTLDGGLDFRRDVVHFYGFRREDFLDHDDILEYIDGLSRQDVRQHYNNLSTNIGFGTHHTDSTRINFNTGLKYQWLSDRYDAREQNLLFTGNLGRNLPQDPFGLGMTHYFDLEAKADYYHISTPLDTAGSAVVSLKPRIYSSTSNLRFHLGVNASVEADTASYLRVYPLAGADITVVPRVLTAYGFLSGGLQKHSISSFSRQNPFINTAMDYRFMNVRTEVGGGIRGSLTDFVSYNFSVNNARMDNFPFFVTDTTTALKNQFTVVYDKVNRFNFRAELFSQIGQRFHTRLRADLFQYSPEIEPEAWHMPTMEFALNLKYNIQDKIILTGDAFARDSTFGRSFDTEGNVVPVEIHGFHVDFNLGIEYRYTRILSVFLNFNNLQNQSLERWINYPSQRFNMIGGVTYAF
jgi:hypothetical protein